LEIKLRKAEFMAYAVWGALGLATGIIMYLILEFLIPFVPSLLALMAIPACIFMGLAAAAGSTEKRGFQWPRGNIGFQRRSVSPNLKDEIWDDLVRKSNGYPECPYCAYHISFSDAELDHKIPISWGGTNDPANLHYVCTPCNREKGDRYSHEEFMDKKASERW